MLWALYFEMPIVDQGLNLLLNKLTDCCLNVYILVRQLATIGNNPSTKNVVQSVGSGYLTV